MTNREALNVIADMCNALQLHPNSRQGEAMMLAINSLKNGTPSVENKGEWIPVSERLPEESGEYLIAIKDRSYAEISWFYPCDKKWSYRNADIVAWAYIPEPYKAERGE